jgi:pilus assembly protein Flp/PilA
MAAVLMLSQFAARLRDEDRGATAVEYGLMVALIAVVIIGAVAALGTNLSDHFQAIADCIASPSTCGTTTTTTGA